ncbi:hypothetical protein KQX54_020378 [Cotesia glomerata]|uniref:Uncharacterized protein n=1 Tax=Cotesia glomerata TaxID=32391 RepID=A0AAV7I126_COTGL|nr:hypothetical protein KQX54_020378 [Cotesia glomerata]
MKGWWHRGNTSAREVSHSAGGQAGSVLSYSAYLYRSTLLLYLPVAVFARALRSRKGGKVRQRQHQRSEHHVEQVEEL